MATERHTDRVRNAATHSYQPVKHQDGEGYHERISDAGLPALLIGETGAVLGTYTRLHPLVQE